MNFALSLTFVILFSSLSWSNQSCRVALSKSTEFTERNFVEFLKDYDQRSFTVAKNLGAKNKNFVADFAQWFQHIQKDNLSVIEFTTLQLALKADYLKDAIPSEIRIEGHKQLEKNWFKYTGQKIESERLLSRTFPKNVLQTQDLRIQRFHELASSINPKTMELEPNIPHKILNKLAPIGLLVLGLTDTGGSALTGALIGYSVSLAAEYWIHRWVMHSGKTKEKLPWYVNLTDSTSTSMLDLARLHFSHHQELNAQKYKKQPGSDVMNSEYVRTQVIPRLEENGMTPDRQEVYVVETKHATIMEKKGWNSAHITMVPASIAISAYVAADPVVASLTAAAMAYSFIFHVNYVHPLMHQSRGKVEAFGSKFDKWFSETDYFRYIARFHFGHHAKPNTNLSVLPLGYDSLLGTESYLPLNRILKMIEEDLVY
ncbi:MAG: hypothetical protein ACK5W9_14020 [Bdellovibrionales bacterium]